MERKNYDQLIQFHGFVLIKISSAESQKGINVVQRFSIENQKGAIAIYIVTYSDSALVDLNAYTNWGPIMTTRRGKMYNNNNSYMCNAIC